MSVVTSPSEDRAVAAPLTGMLDVLATGMQGRVDLSFVQGADGTRLKDLYQTSPLRVLFPLRAPGDVASAALVTTSGGLVGGDRLAVNVQVDTGAAVQVIGQAAEKVYRSKGPAAWFEVDLSVAQDAWLEWLPQEAIIFDAARLRRRTAINVAPSGTFLGAEMLVFGRRAMGEQLMTGLVRDLWEVRRANRLVWADAMHLAGDLQAQLCHPAGFDGARAVATAVLVADSAGEYLEFARGLLEDLPQEINAAATVTNGVLVTRWLARDAEKMRGTFARWWSAMRHEIRGLPVAMPRLWHM